MDDDAGMDEEAGNEILEIDSDRWVSVEVERQWPKYVATWSIRQRMGDSDYPVQSGTVERMPPAEPSELEAMLSELRRDALQQGAAAAETAERPQKRGSLLGRLFGRQ